MVIRPLPESSPQLPAGYDLSAAQMTESETPAWSSKAGHSFSVQVAVELLDVTARGPNDLYRRVGRLGGPGRYMDGNL